MASFLKKYTRNEKFLAGLLVIFLSFFGFILLLSGPILFQDTSSYIEMSPMRPAGYPLFLSVFKFLGGNYLWSVIFVQIAFNLYAGYHFLKFVKTTFKINFLGIILFSAALLFIISRIATGIVTESIAFPVFLLTSVWLFKGILKRDYKFLLVSMLLNVGLVLIRGQFLFLYPVFFLALAYIFWFNKQFRTFLKYTVILILFFISGQILDKTYHFIKHDKFVSTPFAGSELAANAFYVAKEGDYKLFNDLKTQEVVKSIDDSIDVKGFNLRAFRKKADFSKRGMLFHFAQVSNESRWTIIRPQLQGHFEHLEGIQLCKAADDLAMRIGLKLIKKNWKDFLMIYTYGIVVNGFKDYEILIGYFIILSISFWGSV